MANITPDEVRNRLRSLNNSLIVSDSLLNSTPYIPGCEAYVNTILSDNGLTYSELDSDKQTLVKCAEIALVAMKVVSDAPVEGFKTGVISSVPVSAADREKMVNIFKKEYRDYLAKVGCADITPYTTYISGDDMVPDGEDLTNILLGDEDETTVSLWS